MPKQSEAQKIGSLGHSIVETAVKRSGLWIARNTNEDFGIDMELEFSPGDVTGKFIKVQIKTHKKVEVRKGIVERLSKSFLKYVCECRVPVILVVVSLDKEKCWYTWLQKWIIESGNSTNLYDQHTRETLNVNINKSNNFSRALKTQEFISIANWENSTQLYIALKDLANLSLKMYDEELSGLLFNYLDRTNWASAGDENYMDFLIEKVYELDTSIWGTHRGNQITQLLFKYISGHGEKVTATHIAKLVIRGKQYSRTGINAISVLFDHFPEHAVSLGLSEKFEKFDDPRLHYYCVIRERFPGRRSPLWLDELDLTVGNLRPDFTDIEVLNKWANRGDSFILDCLVKVE